MNSGALVSIVMPCHNAERTLRASIESALAQTHRACELIVVDDGSSDQSLEIAKSYGARLRVLSTPHQGGSAARNRGLSEAKGDWIQFLDADDLLAPEKISRQLALARRCGPRKVYSCGWVRFDHRPGDLPVRDHSSFVSMSPSDWLVLKYSGKATMPVHAWLVSRALARDAGDWSEELQKNQDGEYFDRVVARGEGVVCCPEVMAFYRRGNACSVSRRQSRAALESELRAARLGVRRLLAMRDDPMSREACATLLMRIAYAAYPDHADLSRQGARLAATIGAHEPLLPGGRTVHVVQSLLGWKTARMAQFRFRALLRDRGR